MLQTVNNEIFYHVSRGGAWQVGSQYTVGKELNHYWSGLYQREFFIPPKGENPPLPINIAGNVMAQYLQTGQKPEGPIADMYHFEPKQAVFELNAMGQSYLMLLQEVLFEEVRKEKFPTCPARQNCMWVIPDDREALSFWLPKLKSDEAQILKVSLSGKLHRGSIQFLEPISYNANRMLQDAENYWNTQEHTPVDDCIFEGVMQVMEQIG